MSIQVPFPIDAVYMWVDGADPVWQEKKQKALQALGAGTVPAKALSPARFADNQELRYSLRSLARFAPWIRRVYIVTDEQRPAWLKASKVGLVSHKEIFPPEAAYPVFNNRPIEFCLHRIPLLSEHFLSLNDDFMFGRPVSPLDFFTRTGKPIVWGAKRSPKRAARLLAEDKHNASPHTTSLQKAHKLIRDRYHVIVPYSIKHYPRAMTIAGIQELCSTFPEEVAATLASPFRSLRDVSLFPLYCLYLLVTEQGELRRINGPIQVVDALRGRLAHLGASLGDDNVHWKTMLIRLLRPQTFCLNDAEHAKDKDREQMRRFLNSYFSQPSPYER